MYRNREGDGGSRIADGRCERSAPLSRCLSLGVTAALFACSGAGAANWEIAPRLEGGYRYSDNYRLDLPGNEIEVSGAEADAQVTFRTLDPRTNFAITPRVRSTYFPDERNEDSNDYFLDAEFSDQTPRRRTSLRAAWVQEDVVRSELPLADATAEPQLGETDAVDSGRILQRNRRDLVRFMPSFEYDATQRLRTELGGRYVDADYERTFVNAQQDFREYGVWAGLGYLASERSSLSFRALASRYDTVRDADAFGGEVEWGRDFTENSRMYVRVGAQQTEPENRDSETNVIAGIGGRWSSPRNQLFVDFTRSVNASAAGVVVERHQLRFKVDHDVSPRVAVLLALMAHRDEGIEDGTYPTREYAAAQTGIEWRWNRALSLSATYNYRWQDYADEPSDASSNGFLISLIYEPKRPE